MPRQPAERRTVKRVEAPVEMDARVKTNISATVVDISNRGTLIEVKHQLPIHTSCEVHIRYQGKEIVVHARVRHCFVSGVIPNEKGEKVVLYRAGLEFKDSDNQALEKLTRLMSKNTKKNGTTDAQHEIKVGIETDEIEPPKPDAKTPKRDAHGETPGNSSGGSSR